MNLKLLNISVNIDVFLVKKITSGGKLYSLWDIPSETNHKYNVRYLDDSDENTNDEILF